VSGIGTSKEVEIKAKTKPELLVLDVDGVMTSGQFLYSEHGKTYKVFGPHDSDGLKMLRGKLRILFITADKRGFAISRKRIVDDMGYELRLVSESERSSFFDNELDIDKTIFMGDGIFDAPILARCAYGIAPASAREEARSAAAYVTPTVAGNGAVLDACIRIHEEFFSDE